MRNIKSRFVYARSAQDDVARVLASLRASVTNDQLQVLDRVCVELADEFAQDPSFDVERFMSRCRHGYDSGPCSNNPTEEKGTNNGRYAHAGRGESDSGTRVALHVRRPGGVFVRARRQPPVSAER